MKSTAAAKRMQYINVIAKERKWGVEKGSRGEQAEPEAWGWQEIKCFAF